MFYYIYKITNIKNNKFYHGSHKTSNLNDGYFGSGIYLKRAISRHGKDSFKKENILYCKDEQEMLEKETEYLQIYKNDKTYNLKFCASGGNTREKYTNEQKKIYIQKLIDNPKCPIGKRGNKAFNYGSKQSIETRLKHSNTRKKWYKQLKKDPKKWKVWKDKIVPISVEKCKIMSEIRSKGVRVHNILTGEIKDFKSITECANFFGVYSGTITRFINSKPKNKTKLKQQFKNLELNNLEKTNG